MRSEQTGGVCPRCKIWRADSEYADPCLDCGVFMCKHCTTFVPNVSRIPSKHWPQRSYDREPLCSNCALEYDACDRCKRMDRVDEDGLCVDCGEEKHAADVYGRSA